MQSKFSLIQLWYKIANLAESKHKKYLNPFSKMLVCKFYTKSFQILLWNTDNFSLKSPFYWNEPEETAAGLHQFQYSVNVTLLEICQKTFLMLAHIFIGCLHLMISKLSKLIFQLIWNGMKMFLVQTVPKYHVKLL